MQNLRPYLGIAFSTTVGHAAVMALPFEVGAIIDGLKLSPSVGGILVSIELTIYALTSFLIAPIVGRVSLRRSSQLGSIIIVAASIWSALTVDLIQFAIALGLTGLGFGIIFACANAAGAHTPSPERAYGVGLFIASLFYTVLPTYFSRSSDISSYLIGNFHPHSGIFFAVALFVLVMLPTMSFLSNRREQLEVSANTTFLGSKSMIVSVLCLVMMAFFSLSVFALYAFTERVASSLGMSTAQIGTWTSISFAVAIPGTLLAAWLGRRFGVLVPLAIGLVLQGITAFILGLGWSEQMLWISYPAFTASWYFLYPFLFGIAAEVDPTGRLPTVMGGVYLGFSAIAATVAGFVVQFGGYHAIATFSLILCLVAASVCVPLRRLLARTDAPQLT